LLLLLKSGLLESTPEGVFPSETVLEPRDQGLGGRVCQIGQEEPLEGLFVGLELEVGHPDSIIRVRN
jgi:hypothetical protein